MAQCENGQCKFIVHPHQDNDADPVYPIVVCPICMTKWNGHLDNTVSRPLNPKLPAALRDAILNDQAEHAFAILENELGYTKDVRPNAIIGCSTHMPVLPATSVQAMCRPQSSEFFPTHFVTASTDFMIHDVRVGHQSMFLHSDALPSEAFRVKLETPTLQLKPGENLGDAYLDVLGFDNSTQLPVACSAFKWAPCRDMVRDLIVVVTNVALEPQIFQSWFLGVQRFRT